ncbi:hypothetical protein HKD37_05G013344 [Glycine soja]
MYKKNAMERSNSKKSLKSRLSNENVPPLQIDSEERRGRYLQPTAMSPRFQPYTENIDAGSPLTRHLFAGSPLSGKVAGDGKAFISPKFGAKTTKALQYCGTSSGGSSSFCSRGWLTSSPLSSLENMEIAPLRSPPVYRTPSTGDDDVIVMDAILVRPVSGGTSGRSSSSSGRGSSSSSTEICKAREESGNSRYNSKSQYGRVPEEDRSIILARKRKSEAETSSSSVGAESSTHGPSSDVHQQYAAAESDPAVSTSQPTSAESDHEVTTSEPTSAETHDTLTDSNTFNDWSPLDDGIEVVLLGSDKAPSREQVDVHISGIQHGWTGKRRLLVFEAICKGD